MTVIPTKVGAIPLLLAAMTTMFAALAHAQTPPDAGTLYQQIERQRTTPLLPPLMPAKPVTPPPEMKADTLSLSVTRFRFAGNTLLSAEQLAPAVAAYLNRPLDFNQLQAAAMAVAQLYRDAGWIVRAYLPAQDIEDGEVTIQIVEAVFGRIFLDGDSLRITPARILAPFGARQQAGQPFSAQAHDRALLIADDLPGVSVSGSLKPGAEENQTDVVLKISDEPLWFGDGGLDNTGSLSTGETRTSINGGLNSPFGRGDQINANFSHTDGSDYLRLSYTQSLGDDGWRIGGNTSYMFYHVVAPAEIVAADIHGSSTTFGLEARYPLLRTRLNNLYYSLTLDHKAFDNADFEKTNSQYYTLSMSMSLSGNFIDNFYGGGFNNGSVGLTGGRVNLNGSPNQAGDAATTNTQGHYSKLRYSLSRQQVITPDLALYAAWSGQRANKNLDSSEKFSLGGSQGVRAYPGSDGSGSEGDLLNIELRYKFLNGFSATAFYDWGRIVQNIDNDFIGGAALNRFQLKGYGLSLAWQAATGFNVKAVWAQRAGDNPNALPESGKDQDGTLVKNRWWLSANIPF